MKKLKDYNTPHNVRVFDIQAISIPIVYNKYGDHDPNGLIFILKKDSSRIQKMAKKHFEKSPPQPYKEVQPLVIRANVGYNRDSTTDYVAHYIWYAEKEGNPIKFIGLPLLSLKYFIIYTLNCFTCSSIEFIIFLD